VKKHAMMTREKSRKILVTPTIEIRIPVESAAEIFTNEARMVLKPTTLPIYSFGEFN
jgi:hypothetical protein